MVEKICAEELKIIDLKLNDLNHRVECLEHEKDRLRRENDRLWEVICQNLT